MQYKLIALDLDGTLTNSEKKITPATKAALKRIMKRGARVVLASGRPVFGITHIARELQLDEYGGYILGLNGAKIIECRTGEVIYNQCLPQDILPDVFRFAHEKRALCLTYDGDEIITEDIDNPYVAVEARVNRSRARRVESLEKYVTYPINKCLIVGPPEKMERAEDEARKRFGARLNIYRSEPYFLEIMPQHVDKAASLGRLLDHLHYTREQLVACGDGFNDISMVSFAGLGVAMGNAQEAVKQAADYVTLSNDNDGIARVAEMFF